MFVRRLTPLDVGELKKIHTKFFSNEFNFEDLFGNAMSSLVVTDDRDRILVAGQIKLIAEAVVITDKDIEIEERRKALIRLLDHFKFSVAAKGFDQLHAFVQDEKWIRHLKKYGFQETKGRSLVVSI